MKKLAKYQRQIDAIDYKIVRLFEQRMCTVKKMAEYRAQHDLLPRERKQRLYKSVVKKTTETACDTEVISYTEGLMMYMLSASEKFYYDSKKRWSKQR